MRQQAAESAIITDEIPGENHPEEDDYYQEFLGVPMPSSTDDFGVKGRPGIDFPNLAAIPVTSFTCRNVKESGYFADMETKCQVFHICDGGRKMSFLCPNGTIFRQSHLICDWWFRVDCENSQDYYDPITDTLGREKDRAKHDRMPSESRETMSITTEFKVPPNENHNLKAEGPRFLEATQPLHSSTQRATTVVSYDRKYETSRTTKQRTRQQSQPIQKGESAIPEKQINEQDPEQYRPRADFRSKTEYLPRDSQAKAEEDLNSKDSKEWEYIVRPSSYFEEGPVPEISLSHDQRDGNQNADLDFRGGKNDEILSADRRIDNIPKKEKDCIHDENEGQVLAETASFAGSHRRGRLESITFSQVTDGISSAKVSAKGKSIEKPPKNEDVVTYRPPREEDADSVVTYRPVMDLEKLLHQRREQLTKDDDDEESSNGKPYTGPRAPPNIPLSSGPGAVHSLALYIATGGDNLLYNTYRQTEGNTKGTTPADPTKKVQDRASTSSVETNPSVTESVEFLAQKEEGETKEAVTQFPIIITASNQPIFNLGDSDVFRTSGGNQPRNMPATKEVQYVLVRGRKIVNSRRKSNSIRYLPTEEFSTRSSEKLVTEKTPTKNTEPPSLDINLVTTFLPKDVNIPSSDISFKSLRKDSELVNIRSPIISTLTRKENFQEIKPNKTSHSAESKGKEILGSSHYSTDPLEYTITQRSTTSNEAEENSFSEREQYFRLEKFQPTTKEYGTISSKHFQSKTEVNHKKSDSSARKMKDYLLGNYTSDDSGLFQHINKALSKTNATNMTEEKMNMFYKETVEQTLKEAIAKESLSEADLSETSSTTEESPNSTEDTVIIEKIDETTTMALPDAIEITPFFRLENGKITSTPSKFPKDEDLSTTPSDLRELAQVFSRALSAYLEDPETFREALASVSHPPNPTIPSGIVYDSGENLTNSSLLDEEDDEVLDFSDVQIPTTIEPSKTETTTSKANTGFYITIPLTTPIYKSPQKSTDANHFNSQDAEGPDYKSFSTTESIQEVITSSQNLNNSISLSEQLKSEDSTAINPNLSKEEWSSMQKQSKIKTTEVPDIKHETKSNNSTNEEVSFTIQPSNKPLTENLPPLEIDLLPPFQDPIPNDDDPETDRDTDSFTEINIPTAALDEILNEFVPEELNRLAMTSIEPDVIPDTKSDYLSSYTGTSTPDFLNTNSFQSKDSTSTPISIITSTTLPVTTTSTTTPIPQITQTISNDGQRILTRLTARLPQGTNDRKQNSVSYTTYTNQLLKIITNPTTEKDESLIHAQSASFLPSQPNPNKLLTQGTDKFVEETTLAVEKITTTESPYIEKTTQVLDYEFINIPKTKTPSNNAETISTTEAEIITEMKEDRSYSGNPRLVLLFVNDRSAKGRGINEKNARLLRALLRKDDHHILRSAGLIPDVIPPKEVTTTDYNPYTIASITPRSTTTIKSTTNLVHSEVRTEPPITTYAPKFTMTWEPLKKAQSTFNESPRVEKSLTTESTKAKAEETTPISYEASLAPSSLPEKLVSVPDDTTSILGTDDKSTVSDGRAFDLLRSLYSLTARWG
ncbi:hypothetical protein J437_LFUL014895 [Ladona fulva]|uniref:Chitin-binding type-2 domain-containing protein n=1 Tax=Ladona fulva TaxID=123851 RepID=A0A8K0NWF9_LADFU|nr:hypothetical protein J437_LFUL014895 [Ladona fulva]